VFRVGATVGLSGFVPGEVGGSSAAAADLIYELGPEVIGGIQREGNRLFLQRRPGAPYTSEQLASSLRSYRLVSARAVGTERIEAVFADEATAAKVSPWHLGFDLGRFKVESQSPGRVRLRQRGHSAIDVIEIVEVSASDEWRKLMARELDVMPSSPALFREEFAGMGSVRLVDIPATIIATLYFNARHATLVDARVRRRIATALNRAAIARVATGDASSAVASAPPSPAGEDEVALPARLSLISLEGDSTMLLAASVIRHQLGKLGIAIDVVPLSWEEFNARVDRGDHELLLGPLPKEERRFRRFLSPDPTTPTFSGFADPEYDAAVGAGDLTRAQAILDREVPATPIYEVRNFAAIDSRFCGSVTPSTTSWRWMADLHPCQDDEGGRGEEGATP
jgi:hypothetical protein